MNGIIQGKTYADKMNAIRSNTSWAIIPARSGSKSVPRKNIREFYGYPLTAYSIVAAKLCSAIDRVIVSTDSQEIADMAISFGAEVPFLRPAEISGDKSTDIEFIEHAIRWFIDNEGVCASHLVHLRPTTPIRNPEVMTAAISMIFKDDKSTSLRSGHQCVHPPYKWFKADDSFYWEPLMASSCDEANNPRQDFPRVFIPNGYVDIIKTEFVLGNHLLHGDRMIGFETKEVPDIDTEDDLKKLDLFPESKEAFLLLQNELKTIDKTKMVH